MPTKDWTQALNIPGWMTELELQYLARMGKLSNLSIEIGVWKGRSTYALASAGNQVIAIDSFDGTGNPDIDRATYPDKKYSEKEARENLKDFTNSNLSIIKARSDDPFIIGALRELFIGRVGFIFIDGDHSREGVISDIKNYITLLKNPGGIMAGHDLDTPRTVRSAVEDFFGEKGYTNPIDSIWEVIV